MLLLTTWQDIPGVPYRGGRNNPPTQRDFAFHGHAGLMRFVQENQLNRFEVKEIEYIGPQEA